MRCTEAMEAGAYVLGALPPAERSAYERHIARCTSCREEVAQLAGLPGLLGRLDSGTAGSIGHSESAPPALLDTMLLRAGAERVRGRRRHQWRRAGALLAAACLAAIVGLGVILVDGPGAAKPVVVTMTPVDEDTPVSAMVGYWSDPDGGTDISMSCVYSDASVHYTGQAWLDLWIFPRDGSAGRSVGGWAAGPGDRLTFSAKWPMRPEQIGRMEVRRGPTTLLVYTAT
jgi:anti-sigma factor RsiW